MTSATSPDKEWPIVPKYCVCFANASYINIVIYVAIGDLK